MFIWFSVVRQTEIHTAKPLVSEPSTFELDIATGKTKRYKLSRIDQIPEEWYSLTSAGRFAANTISEVAYFRLIA